MRSETFSKGFLHCNLNTKWYLQTASYIEAVLQTVGTTITNLQVETNDNWLTI